MKTLAILSFIALSAIVMADLPAHSCTSELRTVMRPINQIYHALEANNFELVNTQYQSFLKAVDSINTVCTPGITKLMFQMRLEGLSCESKLETVLAKVQEFENSDVATDDDIIRISTFILSHMPSLQTLCASKPTEVEEEQVPVVEVAQVEVPEVAVVPAPAVESIEQPIAYQGFSEDTPAAVEAVETVEVAAPQQESVSEDAYALNENELRVIANILPHTPYGQLTVVETPVESAQPEQTAEVSDGLDDLTRTELSMFAGLLSHNEAPSVPAAKPAVDHETLNKVNTKIQNLMGSLMSGSASEEKPVAIQAERVEAPFAGTLQKIHEMIDLQKSKSDSEELQKVENPTSISTQKVQELIKVLKSGSAAEEGQAQEWKKVENPALSSIQKVQELMGALRSKSDSEELQKVENPSVSAEKAQELINVLKSGSAAEEGQAQEWKKVETSSSSAEKVQELMDILKSGSAPEEELAQELEKVENPKLSEVFSQLIDSIHNQGKTEEVAEAAPVEVKTPQVRPLPGRIGIQIGSKITHQPAQEPVAVAVTETKKTSDDPRPECLSIAYNSLSVLYMFQADAVAQDIKQLESDFKSLESITNGINSFCVPTINRDETFSGAGDCPNELQTIKDIISKFSKNGPTNYTNVVDTIQNLWSVHKAFVNDCVNQQETQVIQEPVVQVEEAQPELGAIAIQIAPQNDCEVHYSEMIEKLVKMADDAVEENLSEIFKGMGDMRNVINNINRACDVQHRINVFPKGALEKKTCEQDFVNMRSIFANSNMGSLEDLAELTRNVWDACWDLLHDC